MSEDSRFMLNLAILLVVCILALYMLDLVTQDERDQMNNLREEKCTRLCQDTNATYYLWDIGLRTGGALKCYCTIGERITDFSTKDVET